MLAPWKKRYDKPRKHIKKQRHYFANKGPYSWLYSRKNQSYGVSSSHVWMWELDHKESWASKDWCFWTVVLEKTLESPLDCKKIQPVSPKENQSWIFIERTDAEVETPTQSRILAWRIPRTEEPGRLWSLGSKSRNSWLVKYPPGKEYLDWLSS